ncbi:MAG: Ig-like domain-containing protein [Gemmatimonadetes bacterium]|nr:Ig-like domain-containing protein [Gemmatimonadota bacterium]
MGLHKALFPVLSKLDPLARSRQRGGRFWGFLTYFLAGLILLAQASCSAEEIAGFDLDISSITFTIQGESQLRVGKDTKLTAVLDTGGVSIGSLRVLWSSADPGLALVNNAGTALGGETSLVSGIDAGLTQIAARLVAPDMSDTSPPMTHPLEVFRPILAFTGPPADIQHGEAFPTPIRVAVQDPDSNTVVQASDLVTLNITDSAGQIDPEGLFIWEDTSGETPVTKTEPTVTVGASRGVAVFPDLAISPFGSFHLLATVESVEALSPSFDVVPTLSAAISANPNVVQAGEGSARIRVTVMDGNNDPVSGVPVSFAIIGGQAGSSLFQATPATDGSGEATIRLSSTVVGVKTVEADIEGAVPVRVDVDVTPGPVSGERSTVSANPVRIELDDATTVTVTARDAYDNPIPGATVTFSSPENTDTTLTTNAAGDAVGMLSFSFSGLHEIRPVIDGTPVEQAALVFVAAGPVSGDSSLIVANPPSIVAGAGTASVTVTALDSLGSPVPDATVLLLVTGADNTLVQPPTTTSAAGQATGTLSSTKAELKTVSAQVDGTDVVQTVAVVVTPAAVSAQQSSLAASSAATPAAEAVTLTATARDEFGNLISGATVEFFATGSGNTVTPLAVTDVNGKATGSFSSTRAEPKTVSVRIDGVDIDQAAPVEVTPGPASASQSSVGASPGLVAMTEQTTITVTARDAFDNLITGANVQFLATGSGNTLSGSTLSDGAGQATGTLSSTVSETKTVSARIDGTDVTQTASVIVTGAVSAALSTVEVDLTEITATAGSETVSITVTARDDNGNVLSGLAVVLSSTGTGNTLTQPLGPTDAAGRAIGTLSATIAELKTISATIDGTPATQTADVTVKAGDVSQTQSAVTMKPPSINAAGGAVTTSKITVFAEDQFGNRIEGAFVKIVTLPNSCVSSCGSLDQTQGFTNGVGMFIATYSSGNYTGLFEFKVFADAKEIRVVTVTVTP